MALNASSTNINFPKFYIFSSFNFIFVQIILQRNSLTRESTSLTPESFWSKTGVRRFHFGFIKLLTHRDFPHEMCEVVSDLGFLRPVRPANLSLAGQRHTAKRRGLSLPTAATLKLGTRKAKVMLSSAEKHDRVPAIVTHETQLNNVHKINGRF